MIAAARALWRSPLGKVLGVALLLRLTGLFWGLPSTDAWDDDGIAPRDFLVGVVDTYRWSHHTTYPPLQMILLTVATAPVWALALLRASTLAPDALVAAFIATPTMTAMAVIARSTTIAMSLGLLWNVARIGEDLRGSPRAGAWTAAACAASATLTYYSQTSNLDVPYLFWSVASLRWLVRAIVSREPRLLRRVVALAALAVCTKDQAYALFLLALPAAVAAWPIADARARPLLRDVLANVGVGVALGIGILLLVDGAVFNPVGFAGRLRFLLGTASQDHTMYAATAEGRLHLLRDAARAFGKAYPWVFAGLAAVGIGTAWRSADPARRVAGMVPLLALLSFTVAFDLTALRTEDRFVLPQTVMCGIYAGVGCDALHARLGTAWLRALVLGPCFALALFGCAAVDAAMVLDPRYDAEAWMRANIRAGDHLEVYDNNVHLPRLPPGVVVERVDVTPTTARNPLPGVLEVSDRFSNVDERRPRWILLSQFWASRYLLQPGELERLGRAPSPLQARAREDADTNAYFRDLFAGRRGYTRVHVSAPSASWPVIDIHESLDRELWLFERTAPD